MSRILEKNKRNWITWKEKNWKYRKKEKSEKNNYKIV